MDLINSNPFDKVIKPTKTAKKKKEKIKFYNLDELQLFLGYLESKVSQAKVLPLIQNYYAEFDLSLFRLLAFSGVRIGEALALQWSDINYEDKTLTISKTLSQTKNGFVVSTPKTKKSNRVISLDDKTIFTLKRWRLRERELLLANGHTQNKIVFANFRNDIYQRSSRIADACCLHRIGCHGFRHTHASLLFEAKADFKEVQERLGHSDIGMTMNIYTHVTKKVKEETAQKFANYVNF